GLSSDTVASVEVAEDGGAWFGTTGGLNRWKDNHIETYGIRGSQASQSSGLVTSIFQSARGRLWLAQPDPLGYLPNQRFVRVDGAPGGNVYSFAEDAAGNLWFGHSLRGLIRLSPQYDVQQIPWGWLGRKDGALRLVVDRARGALWLGFAEGGVAYFADGQIRASYGAADGLADGPVGDLRFDQDGALWVSTERGLSRLKDGRVATLTTKNGLPCDGVHWLMNDDLGSVWLYTACGLVRIPRSDLEAWAADPRIALQPAVFDGSDGVRLRSMSIYLYTPQVAKTSDGRLWFLTGDGVSVVDPTHRQLA